MTDDRAGAGIRARLIDAFNRLSTSLKFLIILTVGLLPLSAIALLASLRSAQLTEQQQRFQLQQSVTAAANWTRRHVVLDQKVMRDALASLERGMAEDAVCARVSAILSVRATPRLFALFDVDGRVLCASPGFRPPRPRIALLDRQAEAALRPDGLDVMTPGPASLRSGVVRYSPAAIRALNRWTIASNVDSLSFVRDTDRLQLFGENSSSLNRELFAAPVGLYDLELEAASPRIRFGSAQILLTLLPILMWLSAAIIAYVLLDRLLAVPLAALRNSVATHRLGEPYTPPQLKTPAVEIKDLADVFTQFASAQVTHEEDLSRALNRQTRLTREVHHRVKNNLQVIASLISLHARATADPEALSAYSAIQRRVDALAIVHRNHYAQLDEGGGMELKPMLSELVANLRASAGGTGAPLAIAATSMRASLDTGTTLAFVVTEITELALDVDPNAPVAITVDGDEGGHARLTVTSASLRTSEPLQERLDGRYQRILFGLSRQLRSVLDHDPDVGSYGIDFAIEQ